MAEQFEQDMFLPDFDREQTLDELLSGIDLGQLSNVLHILLGCPFALSNTDGKILAGTELEKTVKQLPLAPELEPVGMLAVAGDIGNKLDAAVALLLITLRSSSRYMMASNLHLQAIKEDFTKLQQKHDELQASEARYKELSEQLEQRVEEQVSVIESTHRQLYQAEKMASVGQLAAGVAHEINNPIGFINSNLNTANSYVKDMTKFAEQLKQAGSKDDILAAWQEIDLDFVLDDFNLLLKESIDGAERVTKIVADLKSFSNVDRSEIELANINDVIESACNVASNELTGIDLQLQLAEMSPVRCRQGHIGQVMLNIILNAAKAMESKGQITISSKQEDGSIHVSITDNGPGIPADVLTRVFDPFFTTNDVGQGTGLGLTVSRDIIRAHDGDIKIDSEPGKGTTVSWWIPMEAKGQLFTLCHVMHHYFLTQPSQPKTSSRYPGKDL